MSKLRHVLARRYRKIDGTDEEEKVLVRPEESRRCDTLIDPKTGHPLFLRAENSKDVKPHFALKEKLSDYDRKIKEEISLKTPDVLPAGTSVTVGPLWLIFPDILFISQ